LPSIIIPNHHPSDHPTNILIAHHKAEEIYLELVYFILARLSLFVSSLIFSIISPLPSCRHHRHYQFLDWFGISFVLSFSKAEDEIYFHKLPPALFLEKFAKVFKFFWKKLPV